MGADQGGREPTRVRCCLLRRAERARVALLEELLRQALAPGPAPQEVRASGPLSPLACCGRCGKPLTIAFRWLGTSTLVLRCDTHGIVETQSVEAP